MEEAVPRDRIGRAHVDGFGDVTGIGLPALSVARAGRLDPAWCAAAIHLAHLRSVPDSHVVRGHGPAAAEALRREIEATLEDLDLAARPEKELLALDASPKARGLDPGTSADFTPVGVFIHWEATDDAKIRRYNYEATKQSIQRAIAGEPKAATVTAQRDSAKHPLAASA